MARKKNENGEELENAFEVFMRNYKNVPGFRALIKLLLWFLLFIIIIVVVNVSNTKETKNDTTTTTTVQSKITYKEILDSYLRDGTTISIEIEANDIKYIINGTLNNNVLTGTYETSDTTTRFKIDESKVYEIKMNEEKENDELLNSFNPDYINPINLINILENEKSIKDIDDYITKYTYNHGSDMIIVNIISDKLNNIEITSNNIKYNIIYSN